ncbi:hypothetical protein REPUB_Repub05bG0174300 [Reevesia pubescens]
MEDGENIFEKQVIGMNKTKVVKPPTRLQKHVPASLKLDQMKGYSAAARTSSFEPSTVTNSESATPIPLLTPLALSPNSSAETEEFMFPIDDKRAATATATAFGWKQPAGAGYNVEASTLLTLFQNKCVLVNEAQ